MRFWYNRFRIGPLLRTKISVARTTDRIVATIRDKREKRRKRISEIKKFGTYIYENTYVSIERYL